MTANGKKFALCNEYLIVKAKGLNEYDVELLTSGSEDEEEDEIFKSAGVLRGKRKAKKIDSDEDEDETTVSKKKFTDYKEQHQATLSEANFSINELNKTINNTVITSSEFFSKFNQLIDSIEQKSALFFKGRE